MNEKVWMNNGCLMAKVSDIQIGTRFRTDFGDIESLAMSIQCYGLFNPIVVDNELNLIQGERRLRAHKLLGLEELPIRFYQECDELTKKEIELEENIQRKNFDWIEEVKAKAELDEVKRQIYGSKRRGAGGPTKGWSLKDTAEAIGESIGAVNQDIALAKSLEDFPELLQERNKSSAFKKMRRLRESLAFEVLAEKVQEEKVFDLTVNTTLNKGDGVSWLSALPEGSVSLVLTDPPYGIDQDAGGVAKEVWGSTHYLDTQSKALSLIRGLATAAFRVLANDGVLITFLDMDNYCSIFQILTDAGFKVEPAPIVWDKKGVAIPQSQPTHFVSSYEVALFASKGKKILNSNCPNLLAYKRVPIGGKIHPSQKPLALLAKIIEATTKPGETVADPFAGSGSTLIAAASLNRVGIGSEIDDSMHTKTTLRLQTSVKELMKMESSPDEDMEVI